MLVGRGFIKRSKQIIVFSQSVHIVVASILLLSGMGIISMVIGQTLATITNRFLAYRAFFDKNTKEELQKAESEDWREILRKIWKTAYKSGLSGLSWIFTNRMLAMLGALFIPLSVMGDYGLSKQIADVIYTLSVVWFLTFYPKLTQERIQERIGEVKRMYIKALYIAVAVFAVCTSGVMLFGGWGLELINSKTHFIEWPLLLVLFGATLFDAFTYISTSVLLSRNEVPHYKALVVTAIITVVILLAALKFTSYGVAVLVLVPFACQLVYNHWRWTGMVWLELGILKRRGEKHTA
jgi:O-antigen/teichoic acid export membrane protein